ncbi:MAG: hypothetical protein S4CHLAM6_09270 [Chlamydiae bacterium]|nr:hypothetical protein [Chlamydiota bacterium]
MARVNRAEPSVFGYTPPAKNATNVNKDIISATQAIQASVANANSNKTIYAAAGLALSVIGVLTFQNYLQGVQLGKFSELLEKTQPGTSFNPVFYDGSPNNPVCVDLFLSKISKAKDTIFGAKFANFMNIVNDKTDAEVIEILSTKLTNTDIRMPNGQMVNLPKTTRIGALALAGCQVTMSNFEHLYSQLEPEVLRELLGAASDAANYGLWKKVMEAYDPHLKNANSYPYPYALRASDALDAKRATFRVNVEVDGEAHTIFDSSAKIALNGYVNPQKAMQNAFFQNKIVKDKQYREYIKKQVIEYYEKNDQRRLKSFLDNYPSENDRHIYKAVEKELGVVRTEDGSISLIEQTKETDAKASIEENQESQLN